MRYIKPGASVAGLRTEMHIAWDLAAERYQALGFNCVLTSGTDGKHGVGSLHYVGLAIDLRTTRAGIRDITARLLGDDIRAALGAQYDVVVEDDHIHIEFQPK